MVFAVGLELLDVRKAARTVGAGVAYGVLAWVVLAALVMPLWLSAVDSPA